MELRTSLAPFVLALLLPLGCGDDSEATSAGGGTSASTTTSASGTPSGQSSGNGEGGSGTDTGGSSGDGGDGGDSSSNGGSGVGGDTGSGASGPVGSGGSGNGGSGGDASSTGTGGSDDPGPGPTQDCPVDADEDGFFTLTSAAGPYVARLPPGYDAENPTPTRLLVSLHGCGDTAYNHATWAAVPYALRESQDYIGISLGGRDGTCWNAPEDKSFVDAAIAHVRSCFYVHQKKIVLAGYSSGGDLTYLTSMADAATYAGILIEHSDLQQNVGPSNVASTLAGAAWKLNISIRAGVNDDVYPIDKVVADYDAMIAAGFPAQLGQTQDTHNGTSADWEALIPMMSEWLAP